MKALVTGAAGFLGACIVERAAQAGWEVFAVSRGPLPPTLTVYRNVTRRVCDLVTEAPSEDDLGLIVHCAAAIPSREPDPENVYAYNVAMGDAILRCAVRNPGAALINMSSMSAFGPIDGGEVSETTPADPQDPYGRAKLEVERRVDDAAASGGVRAVSLRLPGMVGARSHANFMSSLADSLIRGESVRALNPDGWFNNIVYGYDLAEFLIDFEGRIPGGHRALTIAAHEPVRIREAVDQVARVAGASTGLVSFAVGDRAPFTIRFEEIRALGYRSASVATTIERFVRDKRRIAEQAAGGGSADVAGQH